MWVFKKYSIISKWFAGGLHVNAGKWGSAGRLEVSSPSWRRPAYLLVSRLSNVCLRNSSDALAMALANSLSTSICLTIMRRWIIPSRTGRPLYRFSGSLTTSGTAGGGPIPKPAAAWMPLERQRPCRQGAMHLPDVDAIAAEPMRLWSAIFSNDKSKRRARRHSSS